MIGLRSLLMSACLLPAALAAQEKPSTILVLDGSGSMWGQIEGKAKIAIARDVVGELLGALPADQPLGLTVYGHRRKGDCGDIETLVAPATDTRAAIAEAVNAIRPKGKTPMLDAVRQAAEALRYTEEKATVILVSDGVETCDADPCATARTLEAAGVDFTAHVVGFDVTDPVALEQMQCLADATGGSFRSAANAVELAEALTTVTVAEPAPVPEPVAVAITFRAVEEGSDTPFEDPVLWTVTQDGEALFADTQGNPLEEELAEGSYTASAYRLSAETEARAQFVATGDGPVEVVVRFPQMLPVAEIIAPVEAVAGSTLSVGWNGPGERGDYVEIGKPGEGRSLGYAYTDKGNPLEIVLPPHAGEYELRYVTAGRDVLESAPITLSAPELALDFPAEVAAGAGFDVVWQGPDQRGDNIQVGPVGSEDYINYAYTRSGNPVRMVAPTDPGDYEIRYVFRNRETILTRPLTVTETALGLEFPKRVVAGSSFEVAWTGPDQGGDNIQIGPRGGEDYTDYAYTRSGNPVEIVAPTEPGAYEIRYRFRDSETLIARPITVTEAELALDFPAQVPAGSSFAVHWTGPDQVSDNIQVGPRGSDEYADYAYTSTGNPVELIAPTEAGEYEVRYRFQDSETLIAAPITVTEATPTLDFPATVPGGSNFDVSWSGPDQQGDTIQIGPRDGGPQLDYAYTQGRNPLSLGAPLQPGDYEIRYVFRDSEVLLRQPITVTPPDLRLTAPERVEPGADFQVGWSGPDQAGDHIQIGKPEGGYSDYSYVRGLNPVTLTAPEEPGVYELRYMFRGSEVAITQPITVTE